MGLSYIAPKGLHCHCTFSVREQVKHGIIWVRLRPLLWLFAVLHVVGVWYCVALLRHKRNKKIACKVFFGQKNVKIYFGQKNVKIYFGEAEITFN